jgi:hypothetical protein
MPVSTPLLQHVTHAKWGDHAWLDNASRIWIKGIVNLVRELNHVLK